MRQAQVEPQFVQIITPIENAKARIALLTGYSYLRSAIATPGDCERMCSARDWCVKNQDNTASGAQAPAGTF